MLAAAAAFSASRSTSRSAAPGRAHSRQRHQRQQKNCGEAKSGLAYGCPHDFPGPQMWTKSSHRWFVRNDIAHSARLASRDRDRRLARSPSDLPHRPLVASDHRIGGQQGDALGGRLGHQHAVERVLVDRRQGIGGNRVLPSDRQLRIAVVQQPAPERRGSTRKSARPSPCLIATSQRLAALNSNSLAGSSSIARRARQAIGPFGRPQEQMRVQQQFQARPPNRCSIRPHPSGRSHRAPRSVLP